MTDNNTTTNPTRAIVEVRNLHVTFSGSGTTLHAVRGVDLSITPGECLALVGESGSGKSATARALLGLAGSTATVTADTLSIAGTDLSEGTDTAWRRVRGSTIGLVLQDALIALDPLRRIGSELAESLGAHTSSLSRGEKRERSTQLLRDVGIPDPGERLSQRPHELSGGLRQRALIASAVANDPPLLIADEPTTALDVTVQAQVLDLLRSKKIAGTALLLISHDLAVVSQLADRIAVMRDGEIVETGITDDILRHPQHPFTRELVNAAPTVRTRTVDRTHSATSADEAEQPGILIASHLTKTYKKRRRRETPRVALDDVSLEVHAGRTLGLVGESGSGKSTIARIALGLLSPDSGEVTFNGQPWSALTEKQRRPLRGAIQTIPQDPFSSFDSRYTVGALLDEAITLAGTAPTKNTLRVQRGELLDQVRLPHSVLGRHPLALSGGQRQRIAIARALASSPSVLICDEPVSALDVTVQATVLDLLTELQRERNVGMLFISHDMAVIQEISDEVAVIHRGIIVESGSTASVSDNPRDAYTQQLLAAVPRMPHDERVSL